MNVTIERDGKEVSMELPIKGGEMMMKQDIADNQDGAFVSSSYVGLNGLVAFPELLGHGPKETEEMV